MNIYREEKKLQVNRKRKAVKEGKDGDVEMEVEGGQKKTAEKRNVEKGEKRKVYCR